MNESKEPLLGEAGVSGREIADLGNVHELPSATDSTSEDRVVNTVSYCVPHQRDGLSSNSPRGRRLRNYGWRHKPCGRDPNIVTGISNS